MSMKKLTSRSVVANTGCWVWLGAGTRDGYGKVRFEGKMVYAHRLMLFLQTGEWGEVAMHACDTPSCINPEHLSWGTHSENALDREAKKKKRESA